VSAEAPHLSIGEVLAQLRDEFPDITISKIRFLESQGLIDPERTPSGYRKFYDDDLVRLRWILFQQKEHFLPLKVIKERLDELPPGDLSLLDPASALDPASDLDQADAAEVEGEARSVPAGEPEPSTAPLPERSAAASASPASTPEPAPARASAPASARTPPARRPSLFAPMVPLDDGAPDTGVVSGAPRQRKTFSRAELGEAAGLDPGQVAELENFGLVSPAREESGEPRFDDDAVEVARVAAGFFQRGVEARHLRMYRTFAEREAVLFGQVLLPYTRQRNPEARVRLQEELVELATLGRRLRTALLREAARETLAE
jgi:DNA-binding transcriptional MerR regulator